MLPALKAQISMFDDVDDTGYLNENLLLTDHAAMDDIATAVEKIRKHADEIVKKYNPGEPRH